MNKCEKYYSNNLEDMQIIAEVLSGNKHAYAKIVKKYQQKLYNLALRITHNSEDALDITQDTFLKVYYNLDKFDSEKPFLPWLIKINHNTALNLLKKKKPGVDIDKVKHLIQTNDEQDKKLFVEYLINSIPEDYRVVIELRHYQDFTYEDIAKELNTSVAAIKSRLFRARKQILETFRRNL